MLPGSHEARTDFNMTCCSGLECPDEWLFQDRPRQRHSRDGSSGQHYIDRGCGRLSSSLYALADDPSPSEHNGKDGERGGPNVNMVDPSQYPAHARQYRGGQANGNTQQAAQATAPAAAVKAVVAAAFVPRGLFPEIASSAEQPQPECTGAPA